MFFWNVAALKAQLAASPLPPRSALRYLVASLLSVNLLFELGLRTATPPLAVDHVAAIANIAILIFGTLIAYAANGGDGGVDFLGRYLSLGWVLGLRNVTGLFSSIVAVALIVELRTPGSLDAPGTIESLSAMLVVLFNALFFWRLAVHIRQVAFAAASGTTPAQMAAS